MTTSSTLQQVNVRLDADLKHRAEEVLAFMGSSATELIRSAYQKVARGAGDYIEAMEVLRDDGEMVLCDPSPVLHGWSIAEDFYRTVGIEPSERIEDTRSWDEVRDDALIAHFEEKGLLS